MLPKSEELHSKLCVSQYTFHILNSYPFYQTSRGLYRRLIQTFVLVTSIPYSEIGIICYSPQATHNYVSKNLLTIITILESCRMRKCSKLQNSVLAQISPKVAEKVLTFSATFFKSCSKLLVC